MSYISSYTNTATNSLVGKAEKKQVKRDKLYREILNACRYGELNVLSELDKLHKEQPFETVDEFHGEIQKRMIETYQRMKTSLKLHKIPGLEVEDITQEEK